MKILLASPRGFCAGVNRAVETLEKALKRGGPLFALHEIVHNRRVVDYFRERGVRFVDSLDDVPFGETVLFSAHGVAPSVRVEAERRFLKTIDATCPLVERVHRLAKKYADLGYRIFYIGHAGHQEVIGTLGEAPDKMTLVTSAADVDRLEVEDGPCTYLTQTTLSCGESEKIVAALRAKFPTLIEPGRSNPSESANRNSCAGICFATRNRQDAVIRLLPESDALVVVGSANSSNSRRLAELGEAAGKTTRLIDGKSDLAEEFFRGEETVLLTAGASAPETVVRECIDWFRNHFQAEIEERTVHEEKVAFPQVPLD